MIAEEEEILVTSLKPWVATTRIKPDKKLPLSPA